jgi:hypothetical protein
LLLFAILGYGPHLWDTDSSGFVHMLELSLGDWVVLKEYYSAKRIGINIQLYSFPCLSTLCNYLMRV